MLVRKTVTALFSDVVMSTELGERLDPESLRQVMSRYFDEMRVVIERHGGTVEKFIGDEVMAVFGVPAVHEDDALRAVRAAAEMRTRLAELNDELQKAWGVRLDARTGINTGEVVAGDPATGSTFVTGEAVVLAKRLEQAAEPGEILLGKATYPLVKDAVNAGPLEAFPVKGKAEPVAPWRLDEVEAGVPGLARRLDAPLVGRLDELERLTEAFERAEREDSCQLLTVLGPAGIGKSRLAAELRDTLGERATWLTGRCLAYGDGITFWPLVQIVAEAGGERAIVSVLEGHEDAQLVAQVLRGTIGSAPAGVGAEETFWAVRRFFEAMSRRSPVVVCLEDIHWAEPTFLDLIEYLSGWIRAAPILLLCLARSDLLERHPAWASPRPNTSVLALEPLSGREADALLEELQGDVDIGETVRERISSAAEGNPLFVEQMVAMVVEEGAATAELRIPPSIQALLAERLDRLSSGERAVIERAAVAGKEFLRGAVVDLSPPELRNSVGRHLMELVRKELIRPDTSAVARDDGFGFRHALIRDAAYDGMPKEVRGELHERFAAWVEAAASMRGTELEEIIGYHLEQAFRYRDQLGPIDESGRELAARGALRLASAGRRAFARGDMPAAAGLLTRATILLRDDEERRLEIAPDFGEALIASGRLVQAEGVLSRAVAGAAKLGNARLESHALVHRAHLRLETDPDGADTAVEETKRALATFSRLGDDLGLARAWHILGYVQTRRLRCADAEEPLRLALEYAERADAQRERARGLIALGYALFYGPTPVEEGIRRCEAILEDAAGDLTVEAALDALIGGLQAMTGSFERARVRCARGRRLLEELGTTVWPALARGYSGSVEMLAGDLAAAERELLSGYRTLDQAGMAGELAALAALLARAAFEQGRLEEAARYVRISEEAAASDDTFTQITWRCAKANVLARSDDRDAADRISRDAVALAEATDCLNVHGDTLVDRAQVLSLIGLDERPALERALELYEAKGNLVSAEKTRARVGRAATSSAGRLPTGPGPESREPAALDN